MMMILTMYKKEKEEKYVNKSSFLVYVCRPLDERETERIKH